MKKNVMKIIAFLRPYALSTVSISVGVAVMITLVSYNLNLFRVEAYFYDIRMKLKGTEDPHPDIALMIMGEKDGENEAEASQAETSSLESQLLVLENLLKQRPKAILFLNRFDPTEVETKPLLAEKFVSLANSASAKGTKIFLGTDVDLGGEVLPPYPLSLLSHAPAVLHKDGSIFGEDKVMRRGMLTVYNEPSVHMHAAYPSANKEELFNIVNNMRGAYFFRPAESWHIMIRYPQNTSDASNFPTVFFSEVIAGKNLEKLAGKIIIIDNMRKDAMNDYAFTPYSRITYANPRILVHASIMDTILKNRGMVIISSKIVLALTLLLTFLLSFITITKSPSRGVFALILLSLGLFLISLVLFKMGLWLRLVHPLLSMFFTYYLIVPYRAILEYKKRWEVQEKHDLLVQVEEMKGNFLSLMSHDLKTPVARIQGLAELVLRQGSMPNNQEDNVKQIINSTENLDKFISKILNLTKVESNEIKLNKRSKDINKIIEQCVQKLEFQAKNKNITVDLRLDPLFPIQLDAALIIQVFTNIIDNAIKYSAAGTQVEISSREVKGFVEVVIRDKGLGMDEEEKSQLFTKFFRGKSHPGDQNKGSGLGLYLSKYFIELHEGSVHVETKKDFGSEFVIQLPI